MTVPCTQLRHGFLHSVKHMKANSLMGSLHSLKHDCRLHSAKLDSFLYSNIRHSNTTAPYFRLNIAAALHSLKYEGFLHSHTTALYIQSNSKNETCMGSAGDNMRSMAAEHLTYL